MRILLISHTCQSPTEGQPRARCLAAMPGVELKVLVPDRWRHYGQPREPVIAPDLTDVIEVGKVRWPWVGPAQFYLHWYPGLAKLLRTFRPDVIDLWEEPWGLVSVQACRLRNRLLPRTSIVSETEQNINKVLPPPFEQFRRYTLSHADIVVGRNLESLDVVRDKGYQGPAEQIGNGVDADLFRPLDQAGCRAQLDLDPGSFYVGYVGRLVEEKGLLDLVEAVAKCPTGVRLLLVGSGPLRPRLEARVAALGLNARVTMLGARPLEDLPVVMNALNVFALPSRTTQTWKEQFGRVIIEAQACEVPVIGSSSGAIPEVVGGGGLVVPEHDPQALAAAIVRMLDHPTQTREMGRRGREQVLELYTWPRVAERMYAIYRQLTGAAARDEGADNPARSDASILRDAGSAPGPICR